MKFVVENYKYNLRSDVGLTYYDFVKIENDTNYLTFILYR